MSAWTLVYDGFDPETQGLREALCTLGNGYFATRGAMAEATADGTHYPGTYVGGLYNRLDTEVAGRVVTNEDLVNTPNWLVFRIALADGEPLTPGDARIVTDTVELDLRRGVLTRHLDVRDADGRETAITERRFVSMETQHLAGQQVALVARNWSGPATITAGIDAGVTNSGVARYRSLSSRHLDVVETGHDGDVAYAQVRTNQSHVRVAQAARTRAYSDGAQVGTEVTAVSHEAVVGHEVALDLDDGVPVTVEKIVALHTSRDPAISESLLDARRRVHRADRFDELLERHVVAWSHLWRRFDVTVAASERVQMIVRLHLFHLLQTVSPNSIDADIGVPARGWHGEAYRGHIFWDELFIFPTLNLRLPLLTRSLLLYRRRRLDEARHAAREAGLKGAMYPWQSGSNGREESQQLHLNPQSGRWLPDHSHLQRHIDIAIAWNVWQYFEVTGDGEFLRHHGGPMLIEIARFLASLTSHNRALDRYEICGVMGPDEYHDAYPDRDSPGLDNNAYTNVMTVWVLLRALELLDRLSPDERTDLEQELKLTPTELQRWADITTKMVVPFHTDDGGRVISQFEGYDDLEEFDWTGYRERYGNIARLDRILEAEGDSTNRYKLSKQADALMLFYVMSAEELRDLVGRLGYELDGDTIERTITYYEQRTSHGSTLSNVVHSWVLSRADRPGSWEFFCRALESDIADVQGGTTAEGIHLGAMAGTVDLLLRGYAGIETRGDVLRLNPRLPHELPQLDFSVWYRGHPLDVTIAGRAVTVRSRAANVDDIDVAFFDDPARRLPAGGALRAEP